MLLLCAAAFLLLLLLLLLHRRLRLQSRLAHEWSAVVSVVSVVGSDGRQSESHGVLRGSR